MCKLVGRYSINERIPSKIKEKMIEISETI